MSVIHNYLKANAKGHDLHIICYGDEKCGLLQNFTAALAKKIDTEWNINNPNVSDIVASRIVRSR